MKLYCVKLTRRRWDFPDNKFAVREGYYTALSLSRVSELIAKNGIKNVEFVRHDDKSPKKTRRLNGSEMLELWKAVAKRNLSD